LAAAHLFLGCAAARDPCRRDDRLLFGSDDARSRGSGKIACDNKCTHAA
jgi:hypothetical protein